MRLADANIFIRYLVDPVTLIDEHRFAACKALFGRVQRGEEEISTSEAILAEVFFVLTSPRQYGPSVVDAAERLDPILAMRGLKIPNKRVCRRALSLLGSYPNLGFEDALTAASLLQSKLRLLSYDSDFDRVPGITRVEP